jgi:hypothetical protein
MDRPVVKKLLELIKFRDTHSAFNGKFQVNSCDDKSIDMLWKNGDSFVRLVVELQPLSAKVQYNEPGNEDVMTLNL